VDALGEVLRLEPDQFGENPLTFMKHGKSSVAAFTVLKRVCC
jgi:hypothetical protein